MCKRAEVLLLTFVICCIASLYSAAKIPDISRIVGGNITDILQHPWQISINTGSHRCGGAIYSKDIVITAAHCLTSRTKKWKVYAGTSYSNSSGFAHQIIDYKIHRNYNKRTTENDIAVLRVKPVFEFQETVKPIPLAKSWPQSQAVTTVSGWGALKSGGGATLVLRAVDVLFIERQQCASKKYKYGKRIKNGMICAGVAVGGKDACQGDSGGPLVFNGTLLGVVSFGIDCALARYPGVYTDVSYYRNWIKTAAEELGD